MSALSSTSSVDDIRDAYADNASWEEDGDVAKAKAFVTACRLLLLVLPRRMQQGGGGGSLNQMDQNTDLIQTEMAKARAFIAANQTGSGGSVRHFSFEDFR